jgi:hypothetical protein
MAVGDCCLFQVRRKVLIKTFPMKGSEGFGNRPDLLDSRSDDQILGYDSSGLPR